jgi:hypothetical protein
MREEIRLGNEALARNDFETAKRCFQQLLATGGTPTQERIAANRLREIQERQEAPLAPSMVKPGSRRKAPRVEEHMVKPGSRRKAPRVKEEHDETTIHKFIRPPDKPIVVIKKH